MAGKRCAVAHQRLALQFSGRLLPESGLGWVLQPALEPDHGLSASDALRYLVGVTKWGAAVDEHMISWYIGWKVTSVDNNVHDSS